MAGNDNNTYDVFIDLEHPRKSTCTCPFANGKRIQCKHMVALYFQAIPSAEDELNKQIVEWNKQEEQEELNYNAGVVRYVNRLSKAELRESLIDYILLEHPGRFYHDFEDYGYKKK